MSKKISGMKVQLFVLDEATGKILAGQKNATLNRSAETIDATSKDLEGNWTESVAGAKSWSIDADGAFVESDEAHEILENAYLDGENVNVYIEFPSGQKYAGNATIVDLPLELPFDDLVTYGLSLQGNGALIRAEKGTAVI